eukprot:COSAG02_NODE_64_length_43111_cov_35.627709_12_plen_96_part_00
MQRSAVCVSVRIVAPPRSSCSAAAAPSPASPASFLSFSSFPSFSSTAIVIIRDRQRRYRVIIEFHWTASCSILKLKLFRKSHGFWVHVLVRNSAF